MTIEETFSEWFRQLDQREQNILLEYVKGRYFSPPSPALTVESGNTAAAKDIAEPGQSQTVCPTCKRGL